MNQNIKIKSIRHAELVSASHQYGFRNKFGMTKGAEQGRSMVEMLGVLAIIGVLSVGGIAGYTSAMRQHKANEIVNATSMLYMMGASQNQGAGDKQMLYSAALGTVPSGVSEITYNAGKTISLAFTDTDICPLVKNKLGDKASDECPTLTVTFGDANQDTQTPIEPECTTGNYKCDDSGELYKCVNGQWEKHACNCDSCFRPDSEVSNLDDVCMGSSLECPAGTPCPSGANC